MNKHILNLEAENLDKHGQVSSKDKPYFVVWLDLPLH